MRFDLHLHIHSPKLDMILDGVQFLKRSFKTMSAALDRIRAEVEESRAVSQSAIALLNGLSAQIRDLKDDPAALEALADALDADTNALAAAVTANTPAAEPPPAEEPPADGPTEGAGPDEGAGGPDAGAGPDETQA